MPTQKTPSEKLLIGKVSQYIAANKVAEGIVYRGSVLDPEIAIKIYMERVGIQTIYDRNPSNSTLVSTTNYLYRILYNPYQAEQIIDNASGQRPIVAGPADQSINISGTASFTIVVTSTLPILSIKWYKNGVEVPGEAGLNYSYAATTSNNGDTVNAVVTNAAGSASSRVATLTVTANISGFFWFGDDDPYPDLAAGIDNLTYQTTFAITTGQPLSIDFPDAASNNRYNVTKYPLPQGLKTTWYNTPFNNGTIPDAVFQTIVTIGQFYYIVSREAMSLDPAQNLVFS